LVEYAIVLNSSIFIFITNMSDINCQSGKRQGKKKTTHVANTKYNNKKNNAKVTIH